MPSTRDKITEALNKVSELESKNVEIWEEIDKCKQDIQNLLKEVILEEKLLSGTKWKVAAFGYRLAVWEGSVLGKEVPPNIEFILNLSCNGMYHYEVPLDDETTLYVDDGDLSVRSQNPASLVTKWGMEFNFGAIDSKINDLEERLNEFKALKESVIT